MALDDLKNDLKRNLSDAEKIPDKATRNHLMNTLWPFIEALTDAVDEIDDAVGELVDQTEDYLQAETATLFAAMVQSSLGLASELRMRAGDDPDVLAKLTAHEQICERVAQVLGDITMIPADTDEGGEDDEEDDDEGEGDDA